MIRTVFVAQTPIQGKGNFSGDNEDTCSHGTCVRCDGVHASFRFAFLVQIPTTNGRNGWKTPFKTDPRCARPWR